jgi:hypothetical protein
LAKRARLPALHRGVFVPAKAQAPASGRAFASGLFSPSLRGASSPHRVVAPARRREGESLPASASSWQEPCDGSGRSPDAARVRGSTFTHARGRRTGQGPDFPNLGHRRPAPHLRRPLRSAPSAERLRKTPLSERGWQQHRNIFRNVKRPTKEICTLICRSIPFHRCPFFHAKTSAP